MDEEQQQQQEEEDEQDQDQEQEHEQWEDQEQDQQCWGERRPESAHGNVTTCHANRDNVFGTAVKGGRELVTGQEIMHASMPNHAKPDTFGVVVDGAAKVTSSGSFGELTRSRKRPTGYVETLRLLVATLVCNCECDGTLVSDIIIFLLLFYVQL